MFENKAFSSCRRTGTGTGTGTRPYKSKEDNVASQALVPYRPPEKNVDIIHEDKMTNTEEVNKGIYFSYPCRRHSCSLVNIPAPCVNKMVSHIEDVESKIQEHLKRFEASLEEWSQAAETYGVPMEDIEQKKERAEKCPELKQKMETLLSEAIHLIKSLETDRADAEEALNKQKSRRRLINLKIDSWSIWRVQEIPLAVQREHEAYLGHIIELQWLLEADCHELDYCEEQKKKLEEANSKLQSDIDYMNYQDPILVSKQNQEVEALDEYYAKKIEAIKLYNHVHEELEETMKEYENAKLKAKQFKDEVNIDICKTETHIEDYKTKIGKLEGLLSKYNKSKENISVNIEKSEEAMAEVIKKTMSSADELANLKKMIMDLKSAYEELSLKRKDCESEYEEIVNDYYATKKTWDAEISDISKDLEEIVNACNEMDEENKKIREDINAIVRHVNESMEKRAEFEHEIQSLMKMIIKNDDYLKFLYREAYHIGAVYHLTKFRSEELEQKILELRRKFKGREDFLKLLTRGKVATGMQIQKRLLSLQDIRDFEREELMRIKAVYMQTLADLEAPLMQLEEDAERMRLIHEKHFEKLSEITQQKKVAQHNVQEVKKKLKRKGKKTHEALTETEVKKSMVFEQVEATKSKTIIYHSKISQLNKDLEEVEFERKDFEAIIALLKEQFTTMKYKREHAFIVFDELRKQKKLCEYRTFVEEDRFRVLFSMRQKTLEEIKKIQSEALDENLRLAQEYQKLQLTYLTEKDTYLNQYDRQLSLDSSIRDEKQLCQLQKKIHEVWQKHFKLVVLYSQIRLAKFQTDSRETIQKILAVQEESSNLMQHISDFFQTLTGNQCENDG